MAQSSIITGQYVELTQTPASVGDRILATIIDYAAMFIYLMASSVVIMSLSDILEDAPDAVIITCLVIAYFPVILYFPLCEILMRGQSLGKMLMKTRVVMADGTSPTVGSCLLRWILYPIDTFFTGFLGVVFILFGKYRQRLGDLAAGTIVIKTTSNLYDFNSLNDYSYVQPGYMPSFPEAANFSTKQVDVITRTLYHTDSNRRADLTYRLAVKVQQYLDVQLQTSLPADVFLRIVLNDFYYYSSTIAV